MNLSLPLPTEPLYTTAVNGSLFMTKAALAFQIELQRALEKKTPPECDTARITIRGCRENVFHLLVVVDQMLAPCLPKGVEYTIETVSGGRGRLELEFVEVVRDVAESGIHKYRH